MKEGKKKHANSNLAATIIVTTPTNESGSHSLKKYKTGLLR